MISKEKGGAAFPSPGVLMDDGRGGEYQQGAYEGMTFRDYCAAQAMPAVIAAYVEAHGRCLGTDHVKYNCAAHAYAFADAMIEERAK